MNTFSQEILRKDQVLSNIEYEFLYETDELNEVFRIDSIHCYEKRNDNPFDTSRFQIYNRKDTILIDMSYLGLVNSVLGPIKLHQQIVTIETPIDESITRLILANERDVPIGFLRMTSSTFVDSIYNNSVYFHRPAIIDDGCGWNKIISTVIDFSGVVPELIDVSCDNSVNPPTFDYSLGKITVNYYHNSNNPCRNELNGLSEYCLFGIWDFDSYFESNDLAQVIVNKELPDSLVINSLEDISIKNGILTYTHLEKTVKFKLIRYNSGINTVNENEYLRLQILGTKNEQDHIIYTKRL